MRTIHRHRPASSPKGDFRVICDYCGVEWLRSRMVRDRAGYLACPDDQAGLDVVTLAEENAAGASQPLAPLGTRDGGTVDSLGDPDPNNPNPPPVFYPL